MNIIELKDVDFSYNHSFSIEGLSISVQEGEFIGLIGSNGSGKTTLLKLITGMLKPTMGEINLYNKHISDYKDKDRAKIISYLPQLQVLNVPLRVKEIVEMGLYSRNLSYEFETKDALKEVGLLDKADSFFSDLSSGQKQRVFLAMTLAQGAKVFLLDEPLSNLDIKYQIELFKLWKDLKYNQNITILISLHNLTMAKNFNRLILLKNGKIIKDGKPKEVLNRDNICEAFEISKREKF